MWLYGKKRAVSLILSLCHAVRNSYSVCSMDADNDFRSNEFCHSISGVCFFFSIQVCICSVRFTCAFFQTFQNYAVFIILLVIVFFSLSSLASASKLTFSLVDSVMVCFLCKYPMLTKFMLDFFCGSSLLLCMSEFCFLLASFCRRRTTAPYFSVYSHSSVFVYYFFFHSPEILYSFTVYACHFCLFFLSVIRCVITARFYLYVIA